ncbi:FecR domain-containing protein [Algibacter sp. TI.3.09]|uniref:FecR family protein n=1 Tax=Algibacter sp. TI.3.09 TaxID=3121298 RepID=UPI003120252A
MKKYLNNSDFINWVYHPNEENSKWMEDFLLTHPEDENLIHDLKKILLAIDAENKINIPDYKEEVFAAIKAKVRENSRKRDRQLLFTTIYKYAAIFIILLGIASFWFFSNSELYSGYDDTKVVRLDTISNTQLILGNKDAVVIDSKDSKVQYKNDGNIVVDNKETAKTSNQKDEFNQLLVPYGKRSKIVLEDNTIVYLNAGSKFIFPSNFSDKKNRTVFLEGEAYFEVTTNKLKPFVVKTINDDYEINVLGTKFNITAYASENIIQTVLKEGSVKILKKENIFTTSETFLKPGQLAHWNKKHDDIQLYDVDPDFYSAWTHGYLSFNRDPLNKILKVLNRYYNVSINIQDQTNRQKKVTGKLDLNDSLDTTLKNLALTSMLKIKKLNKNEYIME